MGEGFLSTSSIHLKFNYKNLPIFIRSPFIARISQSYRCQYQLYRLTLVGNGTIQQSNKCTGKGTMQRFIDNLRHTERFARQREREREQNLTEICSEVFKNIFIQRFRSSMITRFKCRDKAVSRHVHPIKSSTSDVRSCDCTCTVHVLSPLRHNTIFRLLLQYP